jgi:MFS family permease
MRNLLRLKEQPGEEAPGEVYGIRPYILAFSASWVSLSIYRNSPTRLLIRDVQIMKASAMYGYDSAFIGGTLNLPSFQRTFGLENASTKARAELSSNIVSTFQGGAFFGSAFGLFFAEKFGRKPVLMLSALVFSIGAALQMVGRLDLLYAGRVLTGLGVGASAMILPIYVSECSPPLIRGRLVGVFEIMLQIAIVFGFWINYGVNQNIDPTGNKQWHIPVAVQFIPAGLLLITMIPMVESPRWLAVKGKRAASAKALSWVRNLPQDHEYIISELNSIENAVNHELESTDSSGTWKQIFKEMTQKGVRNRLVVSCVMMIFQNLTG